MPSPKYLTATELLKSQQQTIVATSDPHATPFVLSSAQIYIPTHLGTE